MGMLFVPLVVREARSAPHPLLAVWLTVAASIGPLVEVEVVVAAEGMSSLAPAWIEAVE